MYLAIVIALMLVLPLTSGLIEMVFGNDGAFALIIFLKWFVFWSVGMRLLLAGLRQMLQPKYTAEVIFGIKSADALIAVRELGVANFAIGVIGCLSLVAPAWMIPAGLVGAVFYGLTGINHALHKPRGRNQTIAMVSDLGIAIVLGVLLLPI